MYRLAMWKHPHGRGEDLRQATIQNQTLETPPRAWGRLAQAYANKQLNRNTPTGVGKTSLPYMTEEHIRKHPHGRGEDQMRNIVNQINLETPPRAWGRRRECDMSVIPVRNTPTGVGKTPTDCERA